MNAIKAFYNKIIYTGTNASDDELLIAKTRLSNQIALFAFVLVSYNLIANFILGDYIDNLIVLPALIIFALCFWLNKKRKFSSTRLILSIFPTLLVSLFYLLFGTQLQIAPVYLVEVVITIYFFENRKTRFAIIAFIFSNYIATHIILSFITPPLAENVNGHSTHIYFIFALFVIYNLTHEVIKQKNKLLISVKNQNTEIIEQTSYIREQNKKLESKNKALSSFTYIASHDMKTPLRTIISFLDLTEIAYQKNDTQKVLNYVSFAQDGAKDLAKLLEGILSYSLLENDNKIYKSVDLNQVITKLKLEFQKTHPKEFILEFNDLPCVFGSYTHFSNLFKHLIENALKFNLTDIPQINISHSTDEEFYTIKMCDNGIGVNPEFQQKVFDMFSQLHPKSEYPGTGLGLAICTKIVGKYGGVIWMETNDKLGSSVFIRLPIESTCKAHESKLAKTNRETSLKLVG